MQVLTVFAHHGWGSFCHAVLERFAAGLREAGHANDILDLDASKFDPVLRDRDDPNWMDADAPDDEVLARMQWRERILQGAGGLLKRLALKRWLGNRDTRGIIRLLQRYRRPMCANNRTGFRKRTRSPSSRRCTSSASRPSSRRWIERVFTLGFAFGITPEAWNGDIGGRIPLLTHEEALIIQTTILDERAYDAGLRQAMHVLVDEFALQYPGIKRVEPQFFYAVHDGDAARLRHYLDRAHALGREF